MKRNTYHFINQPPTVLWTENTGVFNMRIEGSNGVIDWGDGTKENFVSGDISHDYGGVTGIKEIKLIDLNNLQTGFSSIIIDNEEYVTKADFSPFTGIDDQIKLKNNSSCTEIIPPVTSSKLLTVDFSNNDLTGSLSLNSISELASIIDIRNNTNLTSLKFPTTNSVVSTLLINNTGVNTVDFSGLTNLKGAIKFSNCPNLSSLTFPDSSGAITALEGNNCSSLTGTLDISGLTGLGGDVDFSDTPIDDFIWPSTTNTFNYLNLTNTNVSTLNFSNLSNLGGIIHIRACSNLTSVTFPNSSESFLQIFIDSCNLTGTIDFTPLTNLGGYILLKNNNNLTGINWPASSGGTISRLRAASCNIQNLTWPDWSVNTAEIEIDNNNMSQSDVDAFIESLFDNRVNETNATPELNISGNNSDPSGTYQAPSNCGDVPLGLEQVYELENDSCGVGHNLWTITY